MKYEGISELRGQESNTRNYNVKLCNSNDTSRQVTQLPQHYQQATSAKSSIIVIRNSDLLEKIDSLKNAICKHRKMDVTDYSHYKSLSMLLQDILIAYIKPEFLKRKVPFDEASRATKYRRVGDMHSLVCNHLLPEDTQYIADEIALLARQFLKQYGQLDAAQKQLLSGLDDHANWLEDEESAEVATNPNDTATMSMEQNKRNNLMKNQRRLFNLKEKILAVQLFQSYYNEDLGLFTSATNTNTYMIQIEIEILPLILYIMGR